MKTRSRPSVGRLRTSCCRWPTTTPIQRWAADGESQGEVKADTSLERLCDDGLNTHRFRVCDTESYVTALHWFPSVGNRPAWVDVFVVACPARFPAHSCLTLAQTPHSIKHIATWSCALPGTFKLISKAGA